ncbi:MAG: penicillin-binding transpeptidase domain-containing protein [Candidatus Paceibacteria bacterium]
MKNRLFKSKNKYSVMVDPDEIFLDSQNLEGFDAQQFEGRIEKPISRRTIIGVGVFFAVFVLVFSGQLFNLQIKKGESYYKRSENNTLNQIIIFAERGIIYDRNGVELAWNSKPDTAEAGVFSTRVYKTPGFSHVLGYLSAPAKDDKGKFWQTEYIGKDGLEKIYAEDLKGENGAKVIEVDAHGTIHSENIVNTPKRGADLYTTLDARLQSELYRLIAEHSTTHGFTGGSGVIMDIHTGEILVSTSYPEYDPLVLSEGKDTQKIKSYLNDKRKVFLDRSISGLYAPGSIVKPFFALGALAEGIIDPYKEILSTGSISIPNPYRKGEATIFKDWKAHGWTDMSEAIAVSSDVYFYAIGGGFESQKGLGIANLNKYARLFGIGEKTGVDLPDEKSGNIPSPEWKLKAFKGDPWRIGDTYHTSIGQYGFLVTPLEMTRATAALANGGTLLTPHFVHRKGEEYPSRNINQENMLPVYYERVYEGMREAVTYGTAATMNVPYVEVAAKTGTAQVGISKSKVNSWIIGYFPYKNPKYAFTVMMESGPAVGTVGAAPLMRQLLDYMAIYTPEYFQ